MGTYIARRLAHAALTLLAVATILFVLFRLMPGDPTAQVISPALDGAAQARLKAAFGLDRPLWQQYLIYLANVATLEWGQSFTTFEPVARIVADRMVNTLLLMSAGLAMAIGFGGALGMLMAWRRGGPLDIGATLAALVFQAAPPFVTGILLLMVLSYNLDLLPSAGMLTPGSKLFGLWEIVTSADFLSHLVLPTAAITVYYLATPMLIMRDSMLEVMGSDYVEFARAKGLSPAVVMVRHAARNALLGIVTVASLLLGFAIGGQVVVETVFSWPGMGKLMVEAATRHDYPVAQATFFMLATLVVGLNLLTDLSYGWLDPRIRTGHAR
ncbi:MAG: ABC transporter permease [Alphaproteobacteria bacterium]|nr:ABC transporter permease [Alphaproteobacteria bacterium]